MVTHIAHAEYQVTVANGNARYDDYNAAFWAAQRNDGKLTGRSKLRSANCNMRSIPSYIRNHYARQKG